jgi:hypothetical protein
VINEISQMESFEKENAFNMIFSHIREYSPDLKIPALHRAIEEIAPSFMAGLFERRQCNRQLKYVGVTWDADILPSDDDYFKLGEIYSSLTFNGGSYTIDGYGDRPIGGAYFEWVK